ncbi:MAG: hypothetical protein HS107_12990 [Thermoflexaceae bacterium]|nr:hypothetical protein [Thermoflexaceae bacterium]
MADLKLTNVEPVRIRTEATHWEQRRSRDQYQQRERRRAPRERLLAAILPGRTPETCEFLADLNQDGEPVGIVVRDVATGRVLARVTNEQLARFDSAGAPGGLLFERKG